VGTRASRLHVLIVRGDGSGARRLSVPRRAVRLAMSLAALALLGFAADYALLRAERAGAPGFGRDLDRSAIEGYRRRVAEIQAEVAGWRELHARMWESIGPEPRGAREHRGVGGGTTSEAPAPPVIGPAGLAIDLDRLDLAVTEEGERLRAFGQLMTRAGNVLAALPSRWPVRGTVNSEFGRRASPWTGTTEFHSGIDIAADVGTLVRAPAPGVVVLAGNTPDYGNTLVLDHGHETRTVYGHLQKLLVSSDQKVDRGQTIALTGNTGKSSGPHLHYGIVVQGQPVNPRGYFWD
jgi:murein DD-endopeptidase MepM/ murein hydrolase activator NlpD